MVEGIEVLNNQAVVVVRVVPELLFEVVDAQRIGCTPRHFSCKNIAALPLETMKYKPESFKI